jgi:hypothetical protein
MMKSVNYLSNNGNPRRNRIDLNLPAELKIREAVDAVEGLGADVRLTNAVIKLGEARELVADWAEETGNVLPEPN